MMDLVIGHGGEVGCSFFVASKTNTFVVVMETLVILMVRALVKVLDKVMNIVRFT